ncbi:MAG: regulatory protein RecX [Chloroflexi bacterium]|nr:regulatory protein RecX [Chloroflexota bacterium]
MTSSKNKPQPQPGTITAITAQVRDSQRVNLMINGEFALGVSLDTLAHEGLFVGQRLDAALIARLLATDAYDQAKRAAVRLLEIRPRSERELRERLRQRGHDTASIDAVCHRLNETGLINDQAFANYLVEQRQRNAQRGGQAIRNDLRKHGIDSTTIHQLADTHQLDANDLDGALRHAHKLAPRMQHLDRATFMRRLGGNLQRRGFGTDAVRHALRSVWSEISSHQASADDESAG